MREIDLFFNRGSYVVRQAVLCVGPGYTAERLREFLHHTTLDVLILTGYISPDDAEELMEPQLLDKDNGKCRLPQTFTFCPLKAVAPPEGPYALVFECIEDNSDILRFQSWKPTYLIAEIPSLGISAFEIWERFRSNCQHIQITTLRGSREPQILDWQKDDSSGVELSVVFPMYNVAKYLDQCIQSVTAWKADYVEFLFVNDGSPDNCREIVLEYAKTDKRIKLLDKPNGGCASARQWGLDRAMGRYVGFIDPDDFIDESMYRKLMRAAMVGSYDISYCGYKEYYENNGQTKEAVDVLGWPYSAGTTNPRDIQALIAYARVAIWRGIYKMEMLKKHNIHFYTELRRFDDLPFKVETFAVARSVITVEEHLYYYRLARPGQDVAADDERLYVHFPIFAHLNESVASKKDRRLTDYLQLCKIQTHRYALEKIKPEFAKEYARQARADLATTGSFWRSFFMTKKMLGKKSAMAYWAIMSNHCGMLKRFAKK